MTYDLQLDRATHDIALTMRPTTSLVVTPIAVPGRYKYPPEALSNFKRASVATYLDGGLIKTAAVDVPRYEAGKLVLEAAATNLIPNSEGSAWTSNTPNTPIIGALAGLNGTLLINGSVAGDAPSRIAVASPIPANTPISGSILVDLATCTAPSMRVIVLTLDGGAKSGGGIYTLSTGAVTPYVAGSPDAYNPSLKAVQVAGSVYRMTATVTFTTPLTSVRVYCNTLVGGTQVVAGAPQIETGSASSSYISSGASATTRTADSASLRSNVAGQIGDLVLVAGAERIRQQIEVTLLAFLGEWFLDTSFGVPYLEQITIKNPRLSQVQIILRTKVAAVPGVTRVRDVRLSSNRALRTLAVTITAETTEGLVGPFDLSINLPRSA